MYLVLAHVGLIPVYERQCAKERCIWSRISFLHNKYSKLQVYGQNTNITLC